MSDEHENPFRGLSRQDRTMVARLNRSFKVLISKYHRITTAQATTFLAVWYEQGLTVTALALRCGVKPFTISRHLRDLGPRNRRGDTTFGLVAAQDRDLGDRRERYVFLTEQGVAVARQMTAMLKGEPLPRMPAVDGLQSPQKTDALPTAANGRDDHQGPMGTSEDTGGR